MNARVRLGFIALDAEIDPDVDDEETIARKKRTSFKFPIWKLREKDFDVRHRMGDLLAEMRKWDFANRDKIREAYKKVFGEGSAEAILGCEEVGWLVSLRNVIVHDAGFADAKTVAQLSTHPQLRKTKPNTTIQLDGELVAEFVNIADEKGRALINVVNDWLMANPV